jgi:7-carboxy-7-deazaguanine synthase
MNSELVYKVHEVFDSICGEINGFDGIGQFSTFIRLQGCNLKCRWCDTIKANHNNMPASASFDQLVEAAVQRHVTITGGEPFLHDIVTLANEINKTRYVTIETNGSQLRPEELSKDIVCVMDYKLPSSQMSEHMNMSAFQSLLSTDWIKFVCADQQDFEWALNFLNSNESGVLQTSKIAFSPMMDDPMDDWVTILLEEVLSAATLEVYRDYTFHYSVQLHKIIGAR